MVFLGDSATLVGRISTWGRDSVFVLFGGMKAMRLAARVLMAVVLVVSCRESRAAEAGSSWWPFGQKKEATVAQPADVAVNGLPSSRNQAPDTGPIGGHAATPE